MANHISHAALPYPVKNARFTILVPYLDADGDPTDPTTPDSEVSIDVAAFADAAEEVTTVTGSNGTGYLTLSGAETNGSAIAVAFKVASGPKATLATLYPRVLPVLTSGTVQALSSSTGIQLASGALALDDIYVGCIVKTTGGTGGGGTGGANNQARVITAYTGSTRLCAVSPAWETNTDSTTTYEVLHTELSRLSLADLRAILSTLDLSATMKTSVNTEADTALTDYAGLKPTVAGRTLDVSAGGEAGLDWANVGTPGSTVALSATTVATVTTTATAIAVTTLNGIANNVITAASIADGAIDAATFASDALARFGVIASGTMQAGSTSTTAVLAAAMAYADDIVIGATLLVTGGTGAGQARMITDYVGTTDTATVDTWTTTPDNTSTYVLFATAPAAATSIPPTVNEIVDGIWDEPTAGHTGAGTFGEQVKTDIDDILTDTGTTLDGKLNTIDDFLDSEINAILAAVDTEVNAIKLKTDNLPEGISKNTALSNFEFEMVDSADHVTEKTGLTVTATRSIDGGAYAACANAVTEVGSGTYKINLASTDLNGDFITLRFTATGADATKIGIKTEAV